MPRKRHISPIRKQLTSSSADGGDDALAPEGAGRHAGGSASVSDAGGGRAFAPEAGRPLSNADSQGAVRVVPEQARLEDGAVVPHDEGEEPNPRRLREAGVRFVRYIRKTRRLKLTLEAVSMSNIKWWIDAAYGVHDDMRGHSGGMMSLGKGAMASKSSKHRLNTRSSTEAEIVGTDDHMSAVLWTRRFIEAQGYEVEDNTVLQDNQSAILMERNGKFSSGKKTKHIDVRYFFITDCIEKKLVKVEHCPTEEMIGDFFTKPLQGKLFRKFLALILNLSDDELEATFGPPNRASTSQECVDREQLGG